MSDDHDERDGCLCDCDHAEHEPTLDQDLPPATGGIAGERKARRRPTRTAVEGEA